MARSPQPPKSKSGTPKVTRSSTSTPRSKRSRTRTCQARTPRSLNANVSGRTSPRSSRITKSGEFTTRGDLGTRPSLSKPSEKGRNEKKEKYSTQCLSDEDNKGIVSNSDQDSTYDSAPEDAKLMESAESERKVMIDGKRRYATISGSEPSNGTGSEDETHEQSLDSFSTQPTLEDGINERKEQLKNATVSQKENKGPGKKVHGKRGGSANVFNARSPAVDMLELKVAETMETSGSEHNSQQDSAAQPADLLNSGYKKTLVPRIRNKDIQIQPLKAIGLTKSGRRDKNSVEGTFAATDDVQVSHEPSELSMATQKASAAKTEAERQREILRKGGHREFSSQTLESLCADYSQDEKAESPYPKEKQHHKTKNDDIHLLDPVEAEIVTQQAKYRDYLHQRMKDHPEHYQSKHMNIVYELSADSASGSNSGEYSSAIEKAKRGSNITPIERFRSLGQRNKDVRSCYQSTDVAVVSKQKTGAKRKRDREDKVGQVLGSQNRSHKMLRQYDQAESLRSTDAKDSKPNASTSDANFSKTLKTLWPLIPNALLYATMKKLNNDHRRTLQSRLRSCKLAGERNPTVKIVTRIDDQGDEVELLEENGKIIEPDPHTMSSDLTMLTAARDLLILLSDRKLGLDITSTVADALDPKRVQNSVLASPGRATSERREETQRLRREKGY